MTAAGDLRIETTEIPGLLILRLPVHLDSRGWFKENWQREKMVALGLPDFHPVQHNVSFNAPRGVTRGIHAEPWDKLVSLTTGRAFGAWVDLRHGRHFGRSVTAELDPNVAVFVPRGVGNSYQTLEANTCYSYLVNAHWRSSATYRSVALDDPTIAIPWPIQLQRAHLSKKDKNNPQLDEVMPFSALTPLILGGSGQVGCELARLFPQASMPNRQELDLLNLDDLNTWDFTGHDLVINAAAMTAVDLAESEEGRREAWVLNAHVPAILARQAVKAGFTLIHFSSDYVFDGTDELHRENESFAPLGVYGQSKAAGDLAVSVAPRHYLLRTSWVIGDGANFVATMRSLADKGARPRVVGDQFGRLTPASELARAVKHLVDQAAPYGTYNATGAGPIRSWAQIAQETFAQVGRARTDVQEVSTVEYLASRGASAPATSPRPRHSALDLTKIAETGFVPKPSAESS